MGGRKRGKGRNAFEEEEWQGVPVSSLRGQGRDWVGGCGGGG